MHNALGVVAQLVRASACHAEGRGFEPRQSRLYLHRHPTVFFYSIRTKGWYVVPERVPYINKSLIPFAGEGVSRMRRGSGK